MCIPPRCRAPRCASHCGVKLRNVHPTAESNSAVCFPPWSQAPWCASHCRVNCNKFLKKLCVSQASRCSSHCGVELHGVHHTTESNCTLGSQNRNLFESLVGLKGTVGRNPLRGEHILHERKDLKKKILIC